MALEMKVHRDISTYQAKPMFGLTWRQLAALAVMIFAGGGVFFAVTAAILHAKGATWSGEELGSATSVAMYAMFPFIIPPALWAWWRPMGLKPEIYVQYAIRHSLTQKVINYADTYAHRTAAAGEPVPDAGADQLAEQRSRRDDHRARKQAERRRKTLSEHAPE